MRIRRAGATDLVGIDRLLCQVLEVHHKGRPDLFKGGTKKYTDEQLLTILADDRTPVFAAVDESENLMGYCFCEIIEHRGHNIFTPIKTLYIDDLCVEEACRDRRIGTALYDHTVAFARSIGCYNVTLNVWAFNDSAKRFYERKGMTPQKLGMEYIL